VQLARNLAPEWTEHGIRINTLSSGYIFTQMLQNLFKDYPGRHEKCPVWARLKTVALLPSLF
jgi:NAD(P)-dependent dehydrogenase (short-subunit alcohol dehydrogenase family)